MLVLLSPAKMMNFDPAPDAPAASAPALIERTRELAKSTAKLKRGDLKRMMEISDDLAELNFQRFQAFDPDAEGGKPAILAFAGEVYRGLDAKTLKPADLAWAQDHIRHLSGLYGVLRPLDAIHPYRLEMGVKLKTKRGASLYDFWGTDIAASLDAALAGHKHPVIVNLASNEYFKAANRKALKSPVIDIAFHEEKDGKARALFMFTKVARGLMARWIIDNRIDDPARLKDFNVDGYRYDNTGSTPDALLFKRKQPPPKR